MAEVSFKLVKFAHTQINHATADITLKKLTSH